MTALLLDNALLVVALGALGVGGHRVAGRLTTDPARRRLVTVVLAAAAAVLEALGLGLVGLSGSPGVLCVTTLLLVGAVVAGVRVTSPPTTRAAGPRTSSAGGRIGVGAAVGVGLGVSLIQLHRPVLGQDAVTYHLPEVIGWVQSGQAGRVLDVYYGLPVGNYPVTQEVLLSWAAGIAHSWGAILLLTLATVPLFGLAGAIVLGELDVSGPVAAVAVVALLLTPLITQAWVEPGNDLEATAWLTATVALVLAARREPGLLVPALIAAGLAVGTKTTVVAPTALALALGAWTGRARLVPPTRRVAAGLAAGSVVGAAVGLTWYVRNWVDHGSPLWPFSSFPSGDPRPPIIAFLSNSLLGSLHATLIAHLHGYLAGLSGGTVLLLAGGPGALVIGLLTRRRRIVLAGLITLLGALLYAAGPVTGAPPRGGAALLGAVGSTLRYLMPTWAAGAAALALAATDPDRRIAAFGRVGLLGAAGWSLASDLSRQFSLASDAWMGPGLGLGLLAGAAWTRWEGPRSKSSTLRRLTVAVGSAAALILILALGSHHFSLRRDATPDYASAVSRALDRQPGWANSDAPLLTEPTGLAALAGDRFEHPVGLLPARAACSGIRRLHRRAWIVAAFPPAHLSPALARVFVIGTAFRCLTAGHARLAFADGVWAIFSPLTSTGNVS